MVHLQLDITELTSGIYHFDQFNVKIDLPTYTSEEYPQFLQGTTLN